MARRPFIFVTIPFLASLIGFSAFAADKPKSDDGIDHDAIKKITKEFQEERTACKTDWQKCDADTLTSIWEKRAMAYINCKKALSAASRFGEPELPTAAFRKALLNDKMRAERVAVFVERDARIPNAFGAKEKMIIGCMVNLDTQAVEEIQPINP